MKPRIELKRAIEVISLLPDPLRKTAITALMGNVVPLVGTAGIVIEAMSAEGVTVSIRNRRHVRNHIGGVHAAAMALAAETATGFLAAMNLPGDKLPLLKTMHVDFVKRARGDIRAVATLSEDGRRQMASLERGSVAVEVHATDGTGEEPIRCEMVWAWVPRKRTA